MEAFRNGRKGAVNTLYGYELNGTYIPKHISVTRDILLKTLNLHHELHERMHLRVE